MYKFSLLKYTTYNMGSKYMNYKTTALRCVFMRRSKAAKMLK